MVGAALPGDFAGVRVHRVPRHDGVPVAVELERDALALEDTYSSSPLLAAGEREELGVGEEGHVANGPKMSVSQPRPEALSSAPIPAAIAPIA